MRLPFRKQETSITRAVVVKWIRENGLKVCLLAGKRPLEKNWNDPEYYEAEQERLLKLFVENPHVNIGIITGTNTGLIVIDCDSKKVYDAFKKYKTLTIITGSGKWHLYYWSKQKIVKTLRIHSGDVEADLQGNGVQVVSPLSIHPDTGQPYRFAEDNIQPISEWNGDIQFDVQQILNELTGKKSEPEKTNIADILSGIESGGRDDSAIRLASWYRKEGKSKEETIELLREWNAKNKPPYGTLQEDGDVDDWLHRKVESAWKPPEPYAYQFIETEIFDEATLKAATELAKKHNIGPYIEQSLETVVGERKLKTFSTFLIAAKQSLQVWGETASGKNTVIDAVMRNFPKSSFFKITGASPKAIRYLGEDIKTLYLAEFKAARDKGSDESIAEYDIKLSISEEEGLGIIVVAKDPETGKLKTQLVETHIENIVTTSTDPELNAELRNRIWELATDESINVDVRDRILAEREKPTRFRISREKEHAVMRAHITDVMKNAPKNVWIPYASKLVGLLSHNAPRVRRDTKKLMNAIAAIAKMHYKTRPIVQWEDGTEELVSVPLDFVITWEYGDDAIMGTFTGETRFFMKAKSVAIEILRAGKLLDGNTFAYIMGCTLSTAYKWLNRFVDAGILLKQKVPGRGGKYVYTAPTTEMEDRVIEISTAELVEYSKDVIGKYVKTRTSKLLNQVDTLSKDLPKTLTYTLRTKKLRSTADLPEAEMTEDFGSAFKG